MNKSIKQKSLSRTYTQYAIVVQAFNKMGSGPVSGEVRAYTAEGAPSAPPQDVLCTTLTAQTIRVSWVSPPLAAANGLIKAYKVIYGPSETWYGKYHTAFRIIIKTIFFFLIFVSNLYIT